MGDKDLENLIENIGAEELAVAQKQAQIERLKQLIVKQKKEMAEQSKIISELQARIDNMYDLPADVEQLKIMIGEMRADINKKDTQLELAVADAAQHEAELRSLKLQMNPLSEQLQNYINQVGELRTKLVEMDGLSKLKDQKIHELQTQLDTKQENLENMEIEFAKRVQNRLQEFMDTEDRYQTRIDLLEKEFTERNKATHENFSEERRILEKKTSDLETQLLEIQMRSKDALENEKIAKEQAEKLKTINAEMGSRNEELKKEIKALEEKSDHFLAQTSELQAYKTKNEGVITNYTLLRSLFDEEPLFKMYNIVSDVGSVASADLSKAIGVPSVTAQKYLDKLVKANICELSPDGKVTLKHKITK